MPRMKPGSVVGAFACDHRQSTGLTSATFAHLTPTLFHRGEKVDAVALVVGDDNVVMAVAIEVDKAQAVILALLIYDGCAFRKGEGQFDPTLFFRCPGEYSLLAGVTHNELALPVAV